MGKFKMGYFKRQPYHITMVLLMVALIVVTICIPQVHGGGADDSNLKEIGAWGINDYSQNPNFGSLTYAVYDAINFYSWLQNKGFTGSFLKINNEASERHFEKASVGGLDYLYADACDFVYFAGHGTYDAFHFGISDDNNAYPRKVHYTEANWGDKDLEWIFLASCYVLQEYPSEWDAAFHNPKTLHGITGFNTYRIDSSGIGLWFARYLTGSGPYDDPGPYNIKEAWKKAVYQDGNQAFTWAAVYAIVVVCSAPQPPVHYWNEYLPGYGSGMNPDPPSPQPGLSIYLEYSTWQVPL